MNYSFIHEVYLVAKYQYKHPYLLHIRYYFRELNSKKIIAWILKTHPHLIESFLLPKESFIQLFLMKPLHYYTRGVVGAPSKM